MAYVYVQADMCACCCYCYGLLSADVWMDDGGLLVGSTAALTMLRYLLVDKRQMNGKHSDIKANNIGQRKNKKKSVIEL